MFLRMKDRPVEHVNIADAHKRLDELIDRAAAGETIVIERGDGSSVRVSPGERPAPQAGAYDWDEHWRWLESQPLDDRPQQEVIDEWRGRERY
jgi:antitoxin (DNA-binding transcriptional repressor) of toxin-antitoxin stability system